MTITLIILSTWLLNDRVKLENDYVSLTQIEPTCAVSLTLGARAEYCNFGAEINVQTDYAVPTEISYMQSPYQSIYTTGAWYDIDKWFRIGYEHRCVHPTITRGNIPSVLRYGGYDKVYIRGEIKLVGR